MSEHKARKLITAIPTFFLEDYTIDSKAIDFFIQQQIDAGINSIIVGGSTGELMLLSQDEYLDLIENIFNKYSSRIEIIGCCTSVATSSSVLLAKKLRNIGIKKALCAVPYYVKPSQDSIYEHFKEVSDFIDLIIYSVPSRTGVDMSANTVCKLSHIKGVVGYKDAAGDALRSTIIRKYLLENNQEMDLFAGDDITYPAFYAQGSNGLISVISNLYPEKMLEMQSLLDSNDLHAAYKIHLELFDVNKLLNSETNPVAVKYIISQKFSNINSICRKPLGVVSQEFKLLWNELSSKI